MRAEIFYVKDLKHWLLIVGLCFFLYPSISNAQKYEGYAAVGLGLPAGNMGDYERVENSVSSSGTQSTYTQKNISFAKGFQAQVGGAYWFRPNLAFDVSANYTAGKKQLLTEEKSTQTQTGDMRFQSEAYQLNMLRFSPTLKIKLPLNKVHVSMQTGFLLSAFAWGNQYIVDESKTSGFQQNMNLRANLRARMSMGYTAGLAVNYPLGNGMDAFVSCQLQLQNFTLKSKTVELYLENGANALGLLSTYQRETIYVRKSFVQPSAVNANEPQKLLEKSLPFSSIVFQLGIKYHFGT
jgi:hypothetical protein